MKRFVVASGMVLTLAACGGAQTQRLNIDPTAVAEEQYKQMAFAVEYQLKSQQRLERISYKILKANAEICGPRVIYRGGFNFSALSNFDKNIQPVLVDVMKLDANDRLTVFNIIKGSAADQAGLKNGDVITKIDGQLVGTGKRGRAAFDEYLEKVMTNGSGQPISLTVLRDGQAMDISFSGDLVCRSTISMAESDAVNAYTNGENVFVTRGMMRFVDNDDELAIVLGHEFGHNLMSHVEKTKNNAMGGYVIGGIVDALLGTGSVFANEGAKGAAQAYSVEFEQEADYVGMYMMARAGYDYDNAAYFWRKMGVNNTQSITFSGSHPTSAERFLGLEKIADEIEAKQQNGQVLVPNLKSK